MISKRLASSQGSDLRLRGRAKNTHLLRIVRVTPLRIAMCTLDSVETPTYVVAELPSCREGPR